MPKSSAFCLQRLDLDAALRVLDAAGAADVGRHVVVGNRDGLAPARGPCGRPCAGPRRPAGWSPRARGGGRCRAGRCRPAPRAPGGRPRSCRRGSSEQAWLPPGEDGFDGRRRRPARSGAGEKPHARAVEPPRQARVIVHVEDPHHRPRYARFSRPAPTSRRRRIRAARRRRRRPDRAGSRRPGSRGGWRSAG